MKTGHTLKAHPGSRTCFRGRWGLHVDLVHLIRRLFSAAYFLPPRPRAGSSCQCLGLDGESPAVVRFSCLPLARLSPSVRPLSLLGHRVTTAHHLPSVARDKVRRGSSAPDIFAGLVLYQPCKPVYSIMFVSITSLQPTLM